MNTLHELLECQQKILTIIEEAIDEIEQADAPIPWKAKRMLHWVEKKHKAQEAIDRLQAWIFEQEQEQAA